MAAVERYLTVDLEAQRRALQAKVEHFVATWDEAALGLTAKQVHERLQAGDPPIHVLLTGPGQLTVSVWMMQGDEHRVVARRLRDVLARG